MNETAITPFVTHDLADLKFRQGRIPDDLLWDDATFAEVWALHPDDHPVIRMHGRSVAIPRWQQAYGRDYHFSGQTSVALPVPPPLECLLAWAKAAIDARLNGVLLNWYEGPGHYIGPHHDNAKDLVKGAPIVTVSFGESRTFRLTPGKRVTGGRHDFPAPAGTVFVMLYATNEAWKHSVPKSTRYKGRRISVTFRAFD